MTKIKKLLFEKILKNYDYFILIFFIALFFAVNVRMNLFSYNNFDMGKFDLGNMSQMLWNTTQGRFMYLTDYFGTNLPRWSMSHVDPILLLFLPIFILFPHPLTLVFSQILLVLLASILVYLIAHINTKSRLISLLIALSYLSYPALGYLTAKTGFHGVTAAIPFFLLTFYIYEYMYHYDKVNKKLLLFFWISLIITIFGKEQISLYTFLFGIYAFLFRLPANNKKVVRNQALLVCLVSILWFFTTFFVIIPAFAEHRIKGYEKFAQSLEIEDANVRNVGLDNYFLSRYDAFGDSYTEVIFGILLRPDLAVKIFFGGDKLENFHMTFAPVMYMPFLAPHIAILAVPDLMMNYLTSASGIGTSEIQNHRISMIIPVLMVSSIFAISFLINLISKYFDNNRASNLSIGKLVGVLLSLALLIINIHTSFKYNNSVFWWLRDSLEKHLPQFIAFAKEDLELATDNNLKIGEVRRISELEAKDRECALKIIESIPSSVSVSGPDYLGAHLSLRETYAIFPALFNEADYVIIDVFSKKIASILDLPTTLVIDVINKVSRDPNYILETSCGNLFVYKKVGPHNKQTILPIQERYQYESKYDFTIHAGLTVVDFTLPKTIKRGETSNAQFVYLKKDQLDAYVIFLSFVNKKNGFMYQSVNLPSFAFKTTQDWREDYYYIEDIELALPTFLDPGDYRIFIGMTNYVKTRTIYLGEVELK